MTGVLKPGTALPEVSTCLQDRVTLCSPRCCSGRNGAWLTSTCTLPGSKITPARAADPQMADALPTLRDACPTTFNGGLVRLVWSTDGWSCTIRDRQTFPEVDAITAPAAMGGSHHGNKARCVGVGG